jgi:PTH1 family peptidyl-tRNA hydrolase
MQQVIAGLGNPGKKYQNTKHNIGFMAVDFLAEQWGAQKKPNGFQAEIFEDKARNAFLIKPQTYMNASGDSIAAFLAYFKIDPSRLIVIYDDLTLDIGILKLKIPTGPSSDAGHKGVRSINTHITQTYLRLKVGIGHPRSLGLPQDPADYVLEPLLKEHRAIWPQQLSLIQAAMDALLNNQLTLAIGLIHAPIAPQEKK